MLKKVILFSALAFIFLVVSFLTIKNKSIPKEVTKSTVYKISLAHPPIPTVLIPVIGAKEGGFLAKHNIDLQLVQVAKTGDAMASGSTDVELATGLFPFLVANSKGANSVWIVTITNNFPSLIASYVPKEQIRTVGISSIGNLDYYLASEGLRVIGLDPKKITLVPLVNNQGITAAMDRGDIDAMVPIGPSWNNYVKSHPQNKLITYDISSGPAKLSSIVLMAKGDLVKSNPDALSNLAAALLEGNEYIKQHPTVIEDKLVKDYKTSQQTAVAYVESYLSSLKDINAVPDINTAKTAVGLMLTDVPDLKSYDLSKFVNTDIAKKTLTIIDWKKIKATLDK